MYLIKDHTNLKVSIQDIWIWCKDFADDLNFYLKKKKFDVRTTFEFDINGYNFMFCLNGFDKKKFA